jgi:hypothetical protein
MGAAETLVFAALPVADALAGDPLYGPFDPALIVISPMEPSCTL